MEPFTLTLSNAATLTGLASIPPATPTTPAHRPLIVALHGGSHSAHYYDFSPSTSAATASAALGVPFVAINRPGYLDSTSFYPLPPNTTYFEEYARWLHAFILPALWAEFGAPGGCTCIVLHAHSLGAPGALVCAAYHAAAAEEEDSQKKEDAAYPLGGVVFSGFGSRLKPGFATFAPAHPDDAFIELPVAGKAALMLPPGTASADVRERYAADKERGGGRLSVPVRREETAGIPDAWFPRWKTEWGPRVRCPVMLAVAGAEALWDPSEAHLADLREGLSGSARVDASLVPGAPHNMEMSYWAQGWYARGFGFALECAAGLGAGQEGGE